MCHGTLFEDFLIFVFWFDFRKYFMVFSSSACRETAKNEKLQKLKGENDRIFSSLFWARSFRHGFLQKVFCCVFELPLLRNAQKRHKKALSNKQKVPT
jgi:hypothetical protein